MPFTINKAFIAGKLGQDAELRATTNSSVCTFSVATERGIKKPDGTWENTTDWHDVVLWGKQADALHKHLVKGAFVVVDGETRKRTYEAKDGTKRYVTEISAFSCVVPGSGKKVASVPGADVLPDNPAGEMF